MKFKYLSLNSIQYRMVGEGEEVERNNWLTGWGFAQPVNHFAHPVNYLTHTKMGIKMSIQVKFYKPFGGKSPRTH